MDIVADLALGLPAQIISEIFGVPEPDRPSFLQWGIDTSTFWGAAASDDIEKVARTADDAAAAFQAYFDQLIAERRRRPGTDLISLLIAAYDQNGADISELPALCVLILSAGWLTTSDLIPNGVDALLRHPDQWRKLMANPALIGSAVEEIARFDTAVPFLFRIAKEDLTIGDCRVPAGSVVALGLGAANHDPAVFAAPETFDITRAPNKHLTFGYGVHFCLGAVLARMELTACFEALARRMPNLRFDPDRPAVPRRTSLVFKGFETLPVLF
jgi:cytochrome P450 PksS